MIVPRSDFQPRYQSNRCAQFYLKLNVLMVELNVFIKNLICNYIYILYTKLELRTLRIQFQYYSQFGIKLFISGTLAPRLNFGEGHDHNRPRLHYVTYLSKIDTTFFSPDYNTEVLYTFRSHRKSVEMINDGQFLYVGTLMISANNDYRERH